MKETTEEISFTSALQDSKFNICVHVECFKTDLFMLVTQEMHRDIALVPFRISLLFSNDCCAHNPRCDLVNAYSYLIG